MGNSGSLSLAGAAIKVAAVAGAAALASAAWSYASSPCSQPAAWRDSAEEIDDLQMWMDMQHLYPEMFVSGDDPAVETDDHRIPPDPTPEPSPQGIIKIMTYNIWSVKHIKIIERMKAINRLILKHSPHIILLQEVTPLIYKIFQSCSWWGLYRCSVPPEKATRRFFCMMLSKLPKTKFSYLHFENATTGRGLCVARIKTEAKKKLVVATCHLRRPNPPEMHSVERVSQANAALSCLHHAPNVVLGGDMNWEEISDGPFPLLRRWYDAWSTLRPEENGWTYDTETNGMLTHSRSLQRRLDRFVCKLKDFDMISIEMIGLEAIPGVSYRIKGKKLPVLPSDHYGLVLTICPKP